MSSRYAGGAAAVERLVRSFLVLRTTPSGVQALGTARREAGWPPRSPGHVSYLVDSASSHMLVSKIKPCMSKYKQLVL